MARYLVLFACLVGLSACGVRASHLTAVVGPPLSIIETYDRLARRMDSRIGSLTAAEANQIWGRPDENNIDGTHLRVVWYQTKRPFPELSDTPAEGSVQRSVLNLAASEGDGIEWPVTSSLVLWFNSAGRMVKWQVELQEGSIYHPAT